MTIIYVLIIALCCHNLLKNLDLTMYDPERSFGFLIHDSARLMRREFERRARAIGLTRAQWAAIAHLRRNEGCNQSTLADLLELPGPERRHNERPAAENQRGVYGSVLGRATNPLRV